ncbi:MAG TPA: xanthine dehydrogenase family protein molybdopterin-binding subunit, partial [Bacteroidetes bacterium]|nr:xanthine dehydrogenase family protein molybdopterin-binding subunit [Bacteroidota bacterium]
TEIGQGSDTVLTQIVAEELGVPLEWVSLVHTDTDVRPWDVGVHASRTTFIAGNAAQRAARKAKEQILEVAAELLKADIRELTIKEGKVFVTKNPEQSLPIGKVIRSRHFRPGGQVVIGEHYYDPPTEHQDKEWRGNISATYGFGAHAVQVEVDEETGKVKVKKVAAAHDVGRVINPIGAEGQVDGGVAMGIGYALSEQFHLDRGRLLNPNFTDYKVLTTMDIPEVVPIFVETNDPAGPFGAKGMGEMTMVPTPAAIANAVYHATGIRIRSLPITPEKVLRALKERKQGGK